MKKYLIIGGSVIIVAVALSLFSFGGVSANIPTTEVSRGEFVVSLSENGQLDAKRSMTISAPRIRGNLQIVRMEKEGATVKEGEFLVQFDPTEQQTKLRDAEAELQIAQANLERADAQLEMDLKQLELDLKKAERAFSESRSEAPLVKKEAEMTLELAKLTYEQKKNMLKADIQKMQVELDKAKDNKEQATRDLEKMTLTAPIPGLVVYLEIWKGGSMSKVQEGDSPWGGQGLINLPDLSTMIVETTVSEVDVSKVKLGQKVEITLDAIPGPVFMGTVNEIGTLAHRKERGSQINVFDIEVLIDSSDERLKPGMSAKVDIIINEFDDVLSVPIEAVFERDDTTIVYSKGGDKIPVTLGERNDMSVIVSEGLKEGQEISLLDPTKDIEEQKQMQEPTQKNTRKKKGGSSEMIIIGG
ncbi:MAG: efflux RND transporter periplasmic adaptor subunit [Candidatus Zixiibacteriota bacterium]